MTHVVHGLKTNFVDVKYYKEVYVKGKNRTKRLKEEREITKDQSEIGLISLSRDVGMHNLEEIPSKKSFPNLSRTNVPVRARRGRFAGTSLWFGKLVMGVSVRGGARKKWEDEPEEGCETSQWSEG